MKRGKFASLQVCKFAGPPILNLQSPVSTGLLVAILLLAAFLRFYRLDAQSFWNDEGNSARLSERTVALIIEGTASDIHPPGYYLLLHYWRAVFGHSEFALRALSAVAGLALVLFTYLLGRHLFGEVTGLMAAFLGAISPFAVYYSQEARMYALLAALVAASMYLLVRVSEGCKRQGARSKNPASCILLLASYVLTCVAGLYTQYAFPFILLVHNLVFFAWWSAVARRSGARWRWLAVWAGVQIAIAVLYLLWLPIALRSVTGWPAAGQAYALVPALLNVMRWLAVGNTLRLEEAGVALIGAGVLLLAGLWPRKGRWFGVVSLALYLLLPIALIFALDLYKEAWLKFLIVVLPPFQILVARGVANLARLEIGDWRPEIGRFRTPNLQSLFSILLLALIGFLTFPSLYNLYFNPTYFRDDYRQIAADIASTAGPDTAVILNAPNQWEVFTYYYPDRDVYPAPYRPSRVEEFLSPLAAGYDRLFVVAWGDAESDPQRLIESWLAANAYRAGDRWYGRVRLATYGAAPLPEQPAVALDADFGENIRLRGYALADGAYAPGDVLPVTLFWEACAPISEPYKVTVQLLGDAGSLVAQHDGEPAGGFAPTTTWQPGQAVIDRHGILLPTDLTPGDYTLVVAVYHAATGERLPVTVAGESVGDHLSLSSVDISPR
ncbi:MAG: glycosyltransferase family 39 protein [Anaerolineae bacterium]|nr:glycosyltransferase family 39 protein [Anaerolineae bacterium]